MTFMSKRSHNESSTCSVPTVPTAAAGSNRYLDCALETQSGATVMRSLYSSIRTDAFPIPDETIRKLREMLNAW